MANNGNAFLSFGTAFNPLSVTGLVMWYDANDSGTITKDGSNRVSAWNDKSLVGNNLAQGTGADQPLWVDSIQNGKPIIRFDGVSEFMADLTTSTYSQPNTLFFAGTSPNADGESMFDGGGSTRNLLNRQGTNTYRIYAGTGATGGTASTSFQIFRVLFSNGSGELDINGSVILTGQTINTFGMANPIIGAFDSSGPSGFGDIDVCEILFYNASLSSGDKTAVLNYLNSKWLIY